MTAHDVRRSSGGTWRPSDLVGKRIVLRLPGRELNAHVLPQFADQVLHDFHEVAGCVVCVGDEDAGLAGPPCTPVQRMGLPVAVEDQVVDETADTLERFASIAARKHREGVAVRLL